MFGVKVIICCQVQTVRSRLKREADVGEGP